MLRFCILVAIAASAVSQTDGSALNGVEYDWKSEPKKDYSGSQFDYRVCFAPNTYCDKTEDEKRHVPIAHNCMAACRRMDNCHSAYWKRSNRYCYISYNPCGIGKLKTRNGDVYFQRVNGACPNGLNPYVTPENVYGNEYCLTKGKKCPGDEMYTKENGDPNPWKHQTKKQCADRGNRILTLGMFDWIPNDDETNPDDAEAKGYCHYKVTPCSDDQLEDDEKSYNYKRLAIGETECPRAVCPPPEEDVWCEMKGMGCSFHEGGECYPAGRGVGGLSNVQNVEQCQEWCDNTPGCGMFAKRSYPRCDFWTTRPCDLTHRTYCCDSSYSLWARKLTGISCDKWDHFGLWEDQQDQDPDPER